MKKFFMTAAALAALTLIIGVFAAQAGPETKNKERATVQFTEPTKLLNVILKGEYTFVHDDAKMAAGQDCSYVYDVNGKLVVSFHCVPVQRSKATDFRVVSVRVGTGNGPREIKEYQFRGSTEAHQVP